MEPLSSIGVFGGRGGGGGPGFAPDVARCLVGGGGVWANLPASAMGGGARNFGRGGEGSRGDSGGGVGGVGSSGASLRALRDGGGGGGAPRRLPELFPVF